MAHFTTTSPDQNLVQLIAELAKLNDADHLTVIQGLSIDTILVAGDSNKDEEKEEDDKE